MAVVQTDLRNTIESAKRIRFDPTFDNRATNVQDAISGLTVVTSTISAADSPYNVPASVALILVNTAAGPVTINVPLSNTRGPIKVKDISGNAAANPITLAFAGGELVDGLASLTISNAFGWAEIAPIPGVGWYER